MLSFQPQVWTGPSATADLVVLRLLPREVEGQVCVQVPNSESEFTVRLQAGLGEGHQSRGTLTPFHIHPLRIRKWDRIQARPPGSTPGRQGQSSWDGALLPRPCY